jgi:hypothetical protein
VIKVRLHDEQLETTRLRGLGFQAECDCGWKGHRTVTMSLARAEARWHAGQEHRRF